MYENIILVTLKLTTGYTFSYSLLPIKLFQDFATKKDRRGLLVYKTILQKQTESYYYADTILRSPVSIYCFIFYVLFIKNAVSFCLFYKLYFH